jgi:class 3 adenylate cyclase
MTFDEVLVQIIALLQREGRVAYRALKRRFDLDDEYIEDLKAELIDAKRMAVDEDGKVLVWTDKEQRAGSKEQGAKHEAEERDNAQLSSVAPRSLLPAARAEGERRQLTVMFCDLVDSTVLSTLLDPEELRDVVHTYHAMCAAVISRYAGHTAQHLGDGLLVYFGYPAAHEDDAQRAVRTGLEILTGLQSLNAGLPSAIKARLPHPIQLRIGIHTGLVVVGEIGGGEKRENLALGETPNIAARLQGLAAPDTVVMSAATARLTRNTFALEDLGAHDLKGIAEPMVISRVLGLQAESTDEEEAASARALFLVGRDEEVGLLHRRWEQSKEGTGQVVLLSGEAGIGKSSLVEMSRSEVKRAGAASLTFRCSPYHQHSALYPIIAHLQRLLHWQPEESPAAKLDKLEQLVQASRLPVAEAVPLFAALLSLPVPAAQYPPLNLSPQRQRQQTHDLLVAWLVEEAERQPVQVTWEDVHWADPSTLEVLGLVIEQAPTVRMLNLLTYRPEFHPPWPLRSHITPLTLNRLERLQVEALVTHLAGGKVLPAEVMQHVVSKTDGVPLFVEELTKMVLESGFDVGARHAVPLPTGHSHHVAGCLDGAAGSAAGEQRGGAARRRAGAGVCIHHDQSLDAAGRRHTPGAARAVGGSRTALSTRTPTSRPLHLQARLDPRRGVCVITEEHPPALPSADCSSVRAPVPRPRRDPAGAGRPSLHGGGVGGTRHSLLAAGGTPRRATLGQRGSGHASPPRARLGGDAARDP